MEDDKLIMDDVSKFRLTGAFIWLILLIVIVPGWYSNPVNFSPDSEQNAESTSTKPVVYQAYILPNKGSVSQNTITTPQALETKVTDALNKEPLNVAEEQVAAPIVDKAIVPVLAKIPDVEPLKPTQIMPSEPEVKLGQWLLMVYASKDIKDANKVLGLLDDKYEVWIKEFTKSKSYSVRTGPYKSRALAEKDKTKIDKAIRTQSKIVQVK